MTRVLTVAREFGSGGGIISRMVADRLHWRLLDREILDEVVRMAGVEKDVVERCDERLDPIFHKLLKSLWQGGFERSTAEISKDPFDSAEMTRCARVVIQKAADQGNCVIVGRAGQCLLRDRSDTVHVFVWAPRAYRIRRIANRLPGEKDPEGLMDKMDRARSAFLRREFNANWCDHKLYDLVVDSSLGDEATTNIIVAAIGGESRGNA
jgi:cytidylate kinase